ncbi:MAG: hypothetical protein U0165_17080 [Polyangiaceae bacterium]
MKDRPMWRSLLCAALSASIVLGSRPSVAQDPAQKAAAESLFDAAKSLMKDGKYADACPKFAESDRLDPGVGVKLFLADCYEKMGKSASAWTTFKDAAALASQRKDKREKIARERAGNLESKLSKLTIQVASDAASLPGLAITLDGLEVTKPLWGVAVATDPGEHTIEAKAQGRKTFTAKMTLSEQKQEVFNVPMLAAEAPVTPPTASSTATAAPVASTPPPASSTKRTKREEPPPPPSSQPTVGMVLAGVGVVGLGVGAIFGAQTLSKNSDAAKKCDVFNRCTQEGLDLTDDAKKARTISYVGFGVGAAFLAVGGYLWYTAPTNNPSTARVWVAPAADQRGGGMAVGGAW